GPPSRRRPHSVQAKRMAFRGFFGDAPHGMPSVGLSPLLIIMRFDVLTLFPEIFQGYLTQSILKLAIERGLVEINLWNIRDWAQGKHKSVDDRPFGGGPGMVLMPEPVFACVEAVQQRAPAPGVLVLLTPTGERLTQPVVQELANHRRLLLL